MILSWLFQNPKALKSKMCVTGAEKQLMLFDYWGHKNVYEGSGGTRQQAP